MFLKDCASMCFTCCWPIVSYCFNVLGRPFIPCLSHKCLVEFGVANGPSVLFFAIEGPTSFWPYGLQRSDTSSKKCSESLRHPDLEFDNVWQAHNIVEVCSYYLFSPCWFESISWWACCEEYFSQAAHRLMQMHTNAWKRAEYVRGL